MQHWQKLQPKDRYIVSANGLLHDYDRRVLTFLYQPLIGHESFSLYMTLWCELEENRLISSSSFLHRNLMNFLGVSLKEIYFWRLKLEGAGLLKTFVKETEEERLFIYELQPPTSPERFFNDGMLNIYLYRKIGEKQYLRLKRFFSDHTIPKNDFTEETMHFEQVFTSLSEEVFQQTIETEKSLEQAGDHQLIGRGNPPELVNQPEDFLDVDFVINNSSMIPKEAFTSNVKRTMGILAFVYGIEAVQMKNMVLDAFEPNKDTINVEDLRIISRKWYQVHHQNKLPQLVDKIQPVLWRSISEAPKNKEEEHIEHLESTSPRKLLEEMSGGAEPALSDLKIIEDIMSKQKLNPGVMNVLIEFSLIKNDMKLAKSYLEKIASHWARKQIKTAKDAIEFARNEDKKYQEWATNGSSNFRKSTRKPTRTEVIPEWFKKKNDDHENTESITESKEEEFDFELEKRKLEEELKQFRKER